MIVVITKFTSGAWAVVVLMPLLMALLFWIRRHYRVTRERLEDGIAEERDAAPVENRVLLRDKGTEDARAYARWYAERIAAAGGREVEAYDGTPDAGDGFATVVVPEAIEQRSLRAEFGT